MKTIKQIKQLVEIFSTNSDSTSNNSLLTSVRDNYIPLFQFNIEAFSSEKAQLVFEKIGENVSRRTSVPYLPQFGIRIVHKKVGSLTNILYLYR